MQRLEKLTYILLILVSVVSLGLLLEQRFRKSTGVTVNDTTESGLIGQKYAGALAAQNERPKRLILFISDHCHYCAESTLFYQKLSNLQNQNPSLFSIRAAGMQPTSDLKAYLDKNGIGVESVEELPKGANRITGTPTLMIVDDHNMIRSAFIGKLTPDRETTVIDALSN